MFEEKKRMIRIWTRFDEQIDTGNSFVGKSEICLEFPYPLKTGRTRVSGAFTVIMNGKIEVGRVRTALIKATKIGCW